MKIHHRNLDINDLKKIFNSKPDFYENDLVLDDLNDEEISIEEALETCQERDYKLLSITDKDQTLTIIHGFPGDTAIWCPISDQGDHFIKNDVKTPLLNTFTKWYKKETHDGHQFNQDLFYSHSEGTDKLSIN